MFFKTLALLSLLLASVITDDPNECESEFDEFGDDVDEDAEFATEALDWTVVEEDISVLELVIGELEECMDPELDPVGDDLLITMSIRSSLG